MSDIEDVESGSRASEKQPAYVFAKFGVYGHQSLDEIEVLELANEFRRKLADIHQRQHNAVVDYRIAAFPHFWNAQVDVAAINAAIFETEREIKKFHSEVRHRNALTAPLRAKLKAARAARASCVSRLSAASRDWYSHLRGFTKWFATVREWHLVKDLEDRKAAYLDLEIPPEFQEYFELYCRFDLECRELFREYQNLGLHSAIRGEIVKATKPKIGKNGPGIRYFYGRAPELRPWRNITYQKSGKSWKTYLQGTPSLSAEPVYTNHTSGGDETVYLVRHQIGTSQHPRVIQYKVKFDKHLPDDAVIQRWTLSVDDHGKRHAKPIIVGHPNKPKGDGVFGYTFVLEALPSGVAVARFFGDHVQETLVVPKWVLHRRAALERAQAEVDEVCNSHLSSLGISLDPLEGISALRKHCQTTPTDARSGSLLDTCCLKLSQARKITDRAIRTIEDIYRFVAAKVCRLHGFVQHPSDDLAKQKLYDKRNLLAQDADVASVRRIRTYASQGKLRQYIQQYGLATADVSQVLPSIARTTDVFTTSVNSLGIKSGAKANRQNRRSQHKQQPVSV